MSEEIQLSEQEKEVQAITEQYLKQLEKMADDLAVDIAAVFSDNSEEHIGQTTAATNRI